MSKIRLGLCSLAMLLILFLPAVQVHAKDLDKLENYTIEVDHCDDGSLNIQYHLEWKVLDSTTDGPLTWIRVGIPNKYVESITALSSNIDEIRYSSAGGDYVRIDLDREYRVGAVVEIDFSIHQHRMYRERDGSYLYSFTPGWFENMKIDEMVIRWKAYDGMSSDMEESGGYYVAREENLAHNQKMQVSVSYEKSMFHFQDDYNTAARSGEFFWPFIISVVVPIVWVFYLVVYRSKRKDTDFYTIHSGMGRAYYNNHVVHRSNSRSHRSGGGCACACACAGGGRAGCSVKEFYSAKKWSLQKNKK